MNKDVQKVFFETFSSPFDTLLIMVVIQLLSSHSENEQYISDLEHYFFAVSLLCHACKLASHVQPVACTGNCSDTALHTLHADVAH